MAEPFLGEIRPISFDFAPTGWALCNGQLLPINQNQALFSILGTTYGGDGRVNFALPDLRGRAAMGQGDYGLGLRMGAESCSASSQNVVDSVSLVRGLSATPVNDAVVEGTSPRSVMPPFAVVNYIIALQGIFPSYN